MTGYFVLRNLIGLLKSGFNKFRFSRRFDSHGRQITLINDDPPAELKPGAKFHGEYVRGRRRLSKLPGPSDLLRNACYATIILSVDRDGPRETISRVFGLASLAPPKAPKDFHKAWYVIERAAPASKTACRRARRQALELLAELSH